MANEYVSGGYKDRLRVAARAGRNEGQCHVSFKISNIDLFQIEKHFRRSSVPRSMTWEATDYNEDDRRKIESAIIKHLCNIPYHQNFHLRYFIFRFCQRNLKTRPKLLAHFYKNLTMIAN